MSDRIPADYELTDAYKKATHTDKPTIKNAVDKVLKSFGTMPFNRSHVVAVIIKDGLASSSSDKSMSETVRRNLYLKMQDGEIRYTGESKNGQLMMEVVPDGESHD